MKNIAIIPARAGSKGLIDKNIRMMNGKPLMAYSICAARASGLFETVMVSTDSEKYADIAREFGAEVPFLRSRYTASDVASSWDMVEEVLKRYMDLGEEFDTFCLLQPTSPLRVEKDIRDAYDLYNDRSAVSVVSVTELEHPLEWCGKLDDTLSLRGFVTRDCMRRRQDNKPYYRPNGAIYIMSTSEFNRDRFMYREGSYAYIMPKERSVDIDTEYDFKLAEFLISS